MPYISKTTFEIIQDSDIDNFFEDDCFEVDEYIALPILALNRKGYTTTFCCCGHSFYEIHEAFTGPDVEDYEHCIVGTFDTEKAEDGWHRIFYVKSADRSTYITFAKGVVLPSLPSGFEWNDKDNSLRCEYDKDTEVYDYLIELVKTMKLLHEWALGLQENKR